MAKDKAVSVKVKQVPAILLIAVVLTGFILLSGYLPFYFDDAFISFRITQNILNGEGPYLFDGKEVYTSTSLIYPFFNVLPAVLHGTNWIRFIPLWNGIFIALTFAISLYKSGKDSLSNPLNTGIILILMLPWLFGHRCFIYGNSGLETGLYMLSLSTVMHFSSFRIFSPWIIFIRPDGWLAGWAFFFESLIQKDKRGLRQIALSLAAAALSWMLAGYLLFGSIIPQSIPAKANHFIDRFNEIEKGVSYAMFAGNLIPFALFLMAFIQYPDYRKEVRIPLVWAMLYLVFFSAGAAWWPWYLPPLFVSFWFVSMKAGFRLLEEYRITGYKGIFILAMVAGLSSWPMVRNYQSLYESAEACKIRMNASRKLGSFLSDSLPKKPVILLEPLGMLAWYAPDLNILDYPGLASPGMASFLNTLPWKIPHRLTDGRTNAVILRQFQPKAIVLWPEELKAFLQTNEFKAHYRQKKKLEYYRKEKRMDSVSVFVRFRN